MTQQTCKNKNDQKSLTKNINMNKQITTKSLSNITILIEGKQNPTMY